MRSIFWRCGLILPWLAGAALAGARVPETYRDVPASLSVTLDDTDTEPQNLELRLPACFTCGYAWEIVAPATVHMEAHPERAAPGMVEIRRPEASAPAIGGDGVEVMEFDRLAPGHYDVQLAYRRSFGTTAAVRTVALSIDVR